MTLGGRLWSQCRPSGSDWRTRRYIGPTSYRRRTVSSSSGSRPKPRSAQRATNWRVPERVSGRPRRFRKTASAAARLAALAPQRDERMARGGRMQVADRQPSRLGHPCASAVQDQHQGVVTAAQPRGAVRRGEQGVDCGLLQIADRGWRDPLQRDGTDLPAPFHVLGAAAANVAGERAQGGETLVAGLRQAAALSEPQYLQQSR